MVKMFNSPDVQNQLWTIISSGTIAVFPFLIVFVTTRFVGLTVAGMLTYALALVELPRIITIFSVRHIQNMDVKQEFNFNIYLGLRTICAIVATMIFIIFLVIWRFEPFQLAVILVFYFIYLTDAYADVFMGDLQQKGKMRVAGKMQTSGFFAALLMFFVVLFTTDMMIPALITAGMVVFFVYISWIWFYRNHFGPIRVKIDFPAIKMLVMRVIPLLVGGLIIAYVFNAQKYYLEAFFTVDKVAIYGILMFPISLLNLACTSFFQGAIATKTAEVWVSGETKRFKRRVNLQLLFAVGLFIPFIVGVYFLGIPILSWVYAIDLSPYKPQLLILAVGGMARAPIYVLGPVFVLFGKEKTIFYCAILISAIAGPLMMFLVSRYGIYGAAFSNLVIFMPQAIMYVVIYRFAIKRNISSV